MVVSVVDVKDSPTVEAVTQAEGETVPDCMAVFWKYVVPFGKHAAIVVETAPIVPVWLATIVPVMARLLSPGTVRVSPAPQRFCWQSPVAGAVVRD